MRFDIIGDIHGEYELLIQLLGNLGYTLDNGVYKHPNRKAIFLGDLVDRGKEVRSVLKVVKAMHDAGTAEVILGNHEFNLVSYFTKNAEGAWLRPHTERNFKQLESTLIDFQGFQDELEYYIEWFRELPLYIENDWLRAIHASWSDSLLSFLSAKYPENKLTKELLIDANNRGCEAYWAIEFLLKGLEIPLDGYSFFDSERIQRSAVRVQWWQNPEGKSLHELLLKQQGGVENIPIPKEKYKEFVAYTEDAKPLFLGHYCIDGPLRLQQPNLLIIDYCVYKSKRLTAYRFDGEKTLEMSKIVQLTP